MEYLRLLMTFIIIIACILAASFLLKTFAVVFGAPALPFRIDISPAVSIAVYGFAAVLVGFMIYIYVGWVAERIRGEE